MNTTSMEFVLCQQEASKGAGQLAQDLQASSRAPSPLVMSEFMGISNAMSGGALQINPWNLGVCRRCGCLVLYLETDLLVADRTSQRASTAVLPCPMRKRGRDTGRCTKPLRPTPLTLGLRSSSRVSWRRSTRRTRLIRRLAWIAPRWESCTRRPRRGCSCSTMMFVPLIGNLGCGVSSTDTSYRGTFVRVLSLPSSRPPLQPSPQRALSMRWKSCPRTPRTSCTSSRVATVDSSISIWLT